MLPGMLASTHARSTRLGHRRIQPIEPNNLRTKLARPIRQRRARTRVPLIPNLDNPIQIRTNPRMENKALVLERIPVRDNAHDPRLRVLDIVLHDRSAGPVGGAGTARARAASLRAGVEGCAQD
jgi:hypothetical protein